MPRKHPSPNRHLKLKKYNNRNPQYKAVQIAKQYDIDVELMLAIIHAESNFNPIAVSKNGAGGLMQMMPETARELGLTVPKYQDKRKPKLDSHVDQRFDPNKNLHAGLIYFKMTFREI